MIIRLSLSAVCVFALFAVASATVQNPTAPGDLACPSISVSCPADFNYGEAVVFTARVIGGNPNVKPVYNWVVSAGRILQGQGSHSIKLDTSDLGGQTPTATVAITGFDLACPAVASCTLAPIEYAPQSRRFNSYGILQRNNQATRLHAFAVQLQNEPGARGYLLFYGGRRDGASHAQNAATRAKNYLVKMRGIDAGRIVTVNGGFKKKPTIDLWVVPMGATPPMAEPTLDTSEVKITRTRQKKSARPN